MKAKTKLTKLWSFLLSLVMLLSLLPTTALATTYNDVKVNGVSLGDGKYLASNTATTANSSSTKPSSYVAWYKDGTLTLNGYEGTGIVLQGAPAADLIIKLIGDNTITTTTHEIGIQGNTAAGSITITADSGSNGNLTINVTNSTRPVFGINGSANSVTITGSADVTINATTTADQESYGIKSSKAVSILDSASVSITCKTPNSSSRSDSCNGIYSDTGVTINTDGTIQIDVSEAGDEAYSYGIHSMSNLTLTKVGGMTVKWKKAGVWGVPLSPSSASFSDTDHAVNVDKTNCYASYRFGTPHTVEVVNGTLTGPGVLNAKSSGKFLENDKVNITPATKKGRSGEEIPFKEWTFSDVMLDKSATTASNSFTVPGKDVTVTAKHSPFVGTPTFTPTGTTGTEGTLTFKTVVKADETYEEFRLVKEGNENNESSYISIRSDTTSTSSPYEYSYETRSLPGVNQVDEGNYYVAEYLNGNYYLSEKFTVNYTAPVTTYTVSFNANGGTGTMADVTDISGEYTLPENGFTAPAGKQFKAWSVGGVEKAAGDKITVTANTTVTAVWENIPVVTYTVSFDANGGTGTMADVTGVSGEYTLPANCFTAPAGKQFKAWSVGGVEKAAGDKITVTANTTVTAVWEAIEYNVTVTGGTASVGAGTPITKATMGTTVTLTAGAAPTGQMFDKWVVNGVIVDDANSATTTFVMPAGNVTAEATYKNIPVVTYTVSFDANGGTGSMADATGISGEYTLPANGFTAPDGKQFKAWSVDGNEKAVGDKITVTADTTVTAVWENIPVVTYTVSFDANGGTGTMADVTGVSGEYTLPANCFTAPAGKQFKAWSVGGVEKAAGDKITVTANTTVTAVWENIPVVTYTVSFDANGGTGTMADVTGVSGSYTLPANGFTAPAGKRFKGWATSADGTVISYSSINVTANTTLYAVWEDKPISGGGGYIPPAQTPTIDAGEGVKVTLSTDGTVATITVDPAYELADVVLNGTSKGKVTEVKGLKTGDKLVVKAVKKAAELTEPTKEEILAALADQELAARSKVVTMKNGKKAIRITWYNRNGKMMEFDGVQIFRSTKKSSGYGKKPLFTSKTDKYTNTSVKAGTKYYYKVRGYVVVDGQKYYTDYSLKAIRTVK